MHKKTILEARAIQLKENEELPEHSPLYIKGEWGNIINNRLSSLGRVDTNFNANFFDYDYEMFHNIANIATKDEMKRHKHISRKVAKYIKSDSVVCEIGAGIGGVCCNLLNRYNEKRRLKYIIFDIPHVLHIASIFLEKFVSLGIQLRR